MTTAQRSGPTRSIIWPFHPELLLATLMLLSISAITLSMYTLRLLPMNTFLLFIPIFVFFAISTSMRRSKIGKPTRRSLLIEIGIGALILIPSFFVSLPGASWAPVVQVVIAGGAMLAELTTLGLVNLKAN